MKNLAVFAAVAALSIIGCQDPTTDAVPFEARFESTGTNAPDAACGESPPNFLNTQEGEGEGTGLGQMTFQAQFCNDIGDLLDDDIPTDEKSVPWKSLGHMIFTAANGDELWTTGGGDIVPTDKPGYLFEFLDPFVFVGGTGRFEGASGSGVTESYVLAGGRVEHYWSGTLVLPKGND